VPHGIIRQVGDDRSRSQEWGLRLAARGSPCLGVPPCGAGRGGRPGGGSGLGRVGEPAR